MGRKTTTGSVEWRGGAWRGRISFPKSATRPERVIQWWKLDARDEAQARAQVKALQVAATAGRIQPLKPAAERLPSPRPWDSIPDATPDGRETLKGWSLRWLDERKRRGKKSVRSETSCLATWVWPTLGPLPIAEVTRAQVEAWVERIDEDVREEELSWKTALNAWGLVSKLFADACAGKPREMRVREDDPTEKVAPPDRGARKGKQFLYPSEFLAVLASPDVDVLAREVYAVAVYLYPRRGELEALHVEDVDLAHGTVHFHRARDPSSGEVRETKGNRPRRVPVDPRLLPLLRSLVERAGAGPLWAAWPLWKDAAGQLRKALARAGVARAELLEADDTRKAMTFHDLRATGITWEAIRGTDLAKIQQRAGHTSTNTTLIYVRLADEVRGVRFGEVFPDLPHPLCQGIDTQIRTHAPTGRRKTSSNKADSMVRGEGFEVSLPPPRPPDTPGMGGCVRPPT